VTRAFSLALLVAAGCSRPAADVIVVGEFGSMTGSEATFGQLTHQGIKLAIDEANAAGGVNGKRIDLRAYDTQGRAQEAGTAVTRLITGDKAVAILGENASSLSIAGGRIAQQYRVPLITPASTHPQVTQVGDMVFRVCFIDTFQGYVLARFAREKLSLGKVAVLYDQAQPYSIGLKDDFRKAFVERGGEIVSEQAYTGGDQDFAAQLTTIRGVAPEAVFVPGYYTDAANILLQARRLGMTSTFLGGDGWESPQLGAIAGEAADGSYFASHYSHEDPRPEVRSFVERFRATYGGLPDSAAALGYDAARLLVDAMRRAPALDGPTLAAAIAATRDFRGVTGVFSIDADRNAKKDAVILQMKGGKPLFVTTIPPP
jgi:branched-chain amino acid transport system substrate-binding protein